MKEVIKLGKITGCTSSKGDAMYDILSKTHLPPSIGSYGTLCGIGEEEFEGSISVNKKLTCPDCISIVKVVKKYLNK